MAKKGFAEWILEWDVPMVERAMKKATSDYDRFIRKGVMQPAGLQNWMNRLTGMYLYLKDNEPATYAFRDQHLDKCKLELVDPDASKEFYAMLHPETVKQEQAKVVEPKKTTKKAEPKAKHSDLIDKLNRMKAMANDVKIVVEGDPLVDGQKIVEIVQ